MLKEWTIEQFETERLAALRSLNLQTLLRYAQRWDAQLPKPDSETFWAAVHKARLVLPGLTDEERRVSMRWLDQHGYAHPIRVWR